MFCREPDLFRQPGPGIDAVDEGPETLIGGAQRRQAKQRKHQDQAATNPKAAASLARTVIDLKNTRTR
jgi:hypothetical protein